MSQLSEHVTHRWLVAPSTAPATARRDPGSTAGAPGDRAATEAAAAAEIQVLTGLQDRLAAEATRSMLLVLQGMDASGKDGTIKHVFSGVNPQGVHVTSFKEPSSTELAHDFLWRIHAQVPAAGQIAIFNRSHYEDVVVVRVHKLVAEPVWRTRYEDIVGFERMLTHSGTSVVKIFLHVSLEEQGQRLAERLERPDKRWKAREGDFEDRILWPEFEKAYEDAIAATSTEQAPWYVVPADKKWFRNWAVGQILRHHLEKIGPQYPDPSTLA